MYAQILANSIISGSIYALAAAGMAISFGLLRILNFAHGHLLMLAAYIFYFASTQQSMGILSSAFFTAIVMTAVATFALFIFVLPFLAYNELLTFVSMLTLAIMLESLVSIIFGVSVRSISFGPNQQALEWMGVFVTPIQFLIIASAIVLLSLLALLIYTTSIGRRIRALREQPAAALSLGINSSKVYLFAFVLSTLLSAYAGVMIGIETNIHPTMGGEFTIKALAIMILAGLGNIWGSVAAAYILAMIENFSIGLDFWGYSLPVGYRDAFAYIIILLMLLFRPTGLFNKKIRRA